MRIQLKNKNRINLHSDFSAECSACINNCSSLTIKVKCPVYEDQKRIGFKENELGSVFCCSNSKDYCSSSKTFINKLESVLFGLKEIEIIKEKLNLDSQKLIHNLTKTNGHNIQELYAVVPQELLTQNLNQQLESIQKTLIENPEEAARTFLRIAKNNAAMKVEFSVINKLMEGETTIRNRRHQIRKVTLNLFHIFFQDFKDLNVYVQFEENDDYLIFDYEILHVALYHLIDNSTKYVRPNSTLFVKYEKDKDDFYLKLEMSSLKITNEEKRNLFQEGFSGSIAIKLGKSGKGLGLGTTAKILELNNAELIIENNINPNKSFKEKGIEYEENAFIIKFKNYAQQRFHEIGAVVELPKTNI
jgi:signal transduction histidine kinase